MDGTVDILYYYPSRRCGKLCRSRALGAGIDEGVTLGHLPCAFVFVRSAAKG